MKKILMILMAAMLSTHLSAYDSCLGLENELCSEISSKESLVKSLAYEISRYDVFYVEALNISIEYELKADEYWELYQLTKEAAYADLSREYDVKAADYRQLAYKYEKNIIPTLSRRLKTAERELLSLIRKFDRLYL